MTQRQQEQAIAKKIFKEVADRETKDQKNTAIPSPAHKGQDTWRIFAARALTNLDWNQDNLPDQRKPPQPKAEIRLLLLLLRTLHPDTVPPNSINTAPDGRVGAEWHLENGLSIEIYSGPSGPHEFSFEDTNRETHDGTVHTNMAKLKKLTARLPKTR